MRKVYRLLGIPIWVVETDDDTEILLEPETPDSYQLNAQLTTNTEEPPPFGFSPDWKWKDE